MGGHSCEDGVLEACERRGCNCKDGVLEACKEG